jgi:hypothetical protein
MQPLGVSQSAEFRSGRNGFAQIGTLFQLFAFPRFEMRFEAAVDAGHHRTGKHAQAVSFEFG